MRFHVRYGWTQEVLLPLVKSALYEPPFTQKDPQYPELAYWVPESGTIMDIKKLMKVVTKVERTFNDYPERSDEDFLKMYNW